MTRSGQAAVVAATFLAAAISQTASLRTLSAAQTAAPQGRFPSGPGQAVVERLCINCHEAERITLRRETKERWAAIVDTMAQLGVAMTDDEYDQIVAYLARHFGTSSDSSAGARAGTPAADTFSLAGTWILASTEPPVPEGEPAAAFGAEFSVAQDEATVTIASTRSGQKLSRIYYIQPADKSGSAAASSSSLMATAVWRNGTLSIPAPPGAGAADAKPNATLELSLDAAGQLVVQWRPAPGSPASSTKTTYRRKSGHED
jgi:hypothetical protein